MSDFFEHDKELLDLYRDIFPKAQAEINKLLLELKDVSACENCDFPCFLQDDEFPLFEDLPEFCLHKKWQKAAKEKLENEISKDILQKINEIQALKDNFKCACCATCCKLAGSEFSYDELLKKAENGDNFASQFVSVFVPYNSEEDAREAYPEYFDFVVSKKEENSTMYFYHCKKLDKNLCSDYENRPEICRVFPTNTLVMLPPVCGYYKWQEETKIPSLLSHALISIVEFYLEKLKKVI